MDRQHVLEKNDGTVSTGAPVPARDEGGPFGCVHHNEASDTSADCLAENIKIVFAARFPDNHGFGLLVCRSEFDKVGERTPEITTLRAIVYTERGKENWQQFTYRCKVYFGLTASLQEFFQDLERLMDAMRSEQAPELTESSPADKQQQAWRLNDCLMQRRSRCHSTERTLEVNSRSSRSQGPDCHYARQ